MSLVANLTLPNGIKVAQPTGLFINNEWVAAKKGGKIPVINPSTEKEICQIEEGTEEDIDLAVEAARAAFEDGSEWRSMAAADRGVLLYKLADLMEKNAETLASLESLDNGKSITMARGDVAACIGTIRFYAGFADKEYGQTIETNPSQLVYTRHEPVGVCGQVIPWNFPLLMFCWKIGPALSMGNTIVMKTAEQTPLSANFCTSLIKEAGFPAGVFNCVPGYGKTAGSALAAHMDVDKIAFTGSTAVGRQILKYAANSNLKKSTLELGGKSPNIVFADADLDQAVAWCNFGIYYNHGQCCCAGSRIYVQESIYDEFVKRFVARAKKNKVGDPFNEETFQGPQVSRLQYDRIMAYVDSARDEGATINVGGDRHGSEGYFIQPTVISDVDENMKVMQEEIFGPVVAISKFKDEADVLKKAHNTIYGLASAVHTKDITTAVRVSNSLKAGTVWINCYNMLHYGVPFGGFKQSGIGRELGKYALEAYTEVKSVVINLSNKME